MIFENLPLDNYHIFWMYLTIFQKGTKCCPYFEFLSRWGVLAHNICTTGNVLSFLNFFFTGEINSLA